MQTPATHPLPGWQSAPEEQGALHFCVCMLQRAVPQPASELHGMIWSGLGGGAAVGCG